MLKKGSQGDRQQASTAYFPVRHWRKKSSPKQENSLTEGSEFKRSVAQVVKSLEIALRSFNRYGG